MLDERLTEKFSKRENLVVTIGIAPYSLLQSLKAARASLSDATPQTTARD